MLKNNERIITSLFDTDKYKLNMLQAAYFKLPTAHTKYKFVDRKFKKLGFLLPQVRKQLEWASELSFQHSEIMYLKSDPIYHPDFIDYLKNFRLIYEHLQIRTEGDDLVIYPEGPVLQSMMWEIVIMAVVSELYNRERFGDSLDDEGMKRLSEKIAFIQEKDPEGEMKFADFGTRRRFSKRWQERVIDFILHKKLENFVGTSNVYFAKEFGITAIGTMGHEWLQFYQGLVHPRLSQIAALEAWADVYKGSSQGIALTDIIGMDQFCIDFNRNLARLYDGLRHDSGDPISWGERAIKLYIDRGLDPKTKTLVFSDGLDFRRSFEIFSHFKGRVGMSFGIGTNLTNDLGGDPLNIVVKNIAVNNIPTAKISDSPGKTVCESPWYVDFLQGLKENWHHTKI